MRAITKFITASAAVAALATFSAPAFADTLPVAGSSANGNSAQINGTVHYLDTGAGSGSLTITDARSVLNFNDDVYDDFIGQLAFLTFNASTVGGALLYDSGTQTFTQTGLNGSFDYRSAAGGGGTVLLHGTFTNMWLKGKVGDASGGFNSVEVGGTTNFSSNIAGLDLSYIVGDNASFSFSGVPSPPGFTLTNGNTELSSFTAGNISGTFAGATVPEASTWALMIMGFGGAGAMLRSRRRAVATTA